MTQLIELSNIGVCKTPKLWEATIAIESDVAFEVVRLRKGLITRTEESNTQNYTAESSKIFEYCFKEELKVDP